MNFQVGEFGSPSTIFCTVWRRIDPRPSECVEEAAIKEMATVQAQTRRD